MNSYANDAFLSLKYSYIISDYNDDSCIGAHINNNNNNNSADDIKHYDN